MTTVLPEINALLVCIGQRSKSSGNLSFLPHSSSTFTYPEAPGHA
jgi:hypothetical protein